MNRDDSIVLKTHLSGVLAGAALWLAGAVPLAAAGPVEVPLKPERRDVTLPDIGADMAMPEIRIDPEAIVRGDVLLQAVGPTWAPGARDADDRDTMISDSTRARPGSDSS